MEADIIVDGFSRSIDDFGVKYKKFIADGDSSVFHKIQENVKYGKEVYCVNLAKLCILIVYSLGNKS